jgi:hypothetical protein
MGYQFCRLGKKSLSAIFRLISPSIQSNYLSHCKVSNFSAFQCFKSKDNLFRRYTKIYKFIGYAYFCAILLYPDFIINNIEMNNAAINPLIFVPASFQQKVVMIMLINNQL